MFDLLGGICVSIVRIGLAETKNFSTGYDAIFGKKQPTAKVDEKEKPEKPKKKKSKKK